MPKRIAGELQVGEDINFQEGQWRAERIGWAAMAAIILLAALGLFGTGLVSGASAEAEDLSLQYERFGRHDASSELVVTIPADAAEEGEISVAIDGGYLAGVEIDSILPESEEVIGGDPTHFVFAAPESGDLAVSFDLIHDDLGARSGRVSVGGGGSVDLWQFIYP